MKLDLSRALCATFVSLLFLTTAAFAQDDRLLGEWIPSNIPLTPPLGVNLIITKAGANYIALPTQSFIIAPPNGCTVSTSDSLLSLSPISRGKYQANFIGFTPSSCSSVTLDSLDLEIIFTPDNKKFIACQKSAICSGWVRVGEPPELIGTKSVPSTPIAVGGKGLISVSWETQAGASAYKITVKGRVKKTKTVKRGTTTKFKKLPKGSYRVTISGVFKDILGKLSSTKSSKAVKVTVRK